MPWLPLPIGSNGLYDLGAKRPVIYSRYRALYVRSEAEAATRAHAYQLRWGTADWYCHGYNGRPSNPNWLQLRPKLAPIQAPYSPLKFIHVSEVCYTEAPVSPMSWAVGASGSRGSRSVSIPAVETLFPWHLECHQRHLHEIVGGVVRDWSPLARFSVCSCGIEVRTCTRHVA